MFSIHEFMIIIFIDCKFLQHSHWMKHLDFCNYWTGAGHSWGKLFVVELDIIFQSIDIHPNHIINFDHLFDVRYFVIPRHPVWSVISWFFRLLFKEIYNAVRFKTNISLYFNRIGRLTVYHQYCHVLKEINFV